MSSKTTDVRTFFTFWTCPAAAVCSIAVAVRERNEIGDAARKELHGYNMRWKVGSAFSDPKRMFGEYVRSKTFGNMVREIGQMIECFNRMKRVTI